MRVERIPNSGIVIWQPDNARTYLCPRCLRPVFCQYEGDEKPDIECLTDEHVVTWSAEQ